MSNRELIIRKPGEVIDFETVFELNPALETNEPAHRGRMMRVDYTTSVYEYGVTYPKYCNVYLPWCYDENDSGRRYNVLYYQHGNTCDPELFNKPETIRLFDNLFDSGEIDPCIIVCTTYYFDPERDAEVRRTTGLAPAGDNDSTGCPPNFYREVVEDIIPAVETRFHTWLTDTSLSGLRASRDHRAFSGYSRGACCTWYMLHNAFEFFRWYAPMSCMTTAGHDIFKKLTEEEVIRYITAPLKQHPGLPFFIYCTNGDPEKDVRAMNEQLLYLTAQPEFSYGFDPAENNICFAVSAFPHTDLLVPYYYWNSLKILFKA
ncbi:MAG: alpha/beta hydrolase-fold protein [Clostridia bacterium]|nr:alpha/beta hydrolase-fold protein [Clostridia bacterium]